MLAQLFFVSCMFYPFGQIIYKDIVFCHVNAVEGTRRFWVFYSFGVHDLKTVRSKLIILYTLNVSDALLTYLLVGTGYFKEANFLLESIVLNFIQLVFIKILLPAALIAWVYFRIGQANQSQLRLGNYAINLVLLLYIVVNMLHLVWTVSFLVF